MSAAAPASKRPLLALVGALAIVAVGAVAWRASQTRLGTILDCRACATKGQPLEHGWVNVQPGDVWSVQLGPHAGVVFRGPARFEAAGGGRFALSSGDAVVSAGPGGRAIALLPRDLQGGIEGASVGAGPGGARFLLAVSPSGNRVEVLSGQVLVSATTGEKKLAPGQPWVSGKPAAALAPPDADEQRWLDALAR